MKKLNFSVVQKAVAKLCIEANTKLRPDVLRALESAYKRERRLRARHMLGAIIRNARIAQRSNLAICQDTGLPVVFAELGNNLKVACDLKAAINSGVQLGYQKGYLRNSIVNQPLVRTRPGYKPAIIHLDLVKGKNLKLAVLPKGFGCENKSSLKMFLPTADIRQLKQFIIGSVKDAGPDACPPYVLGIGIGGTADYAAFLAKKALLKRVSGLQGQKAKSYIAKLEHDLLKEINKLGIGPMGLGGEATCLGVNILTHPTHIAGLPVAINISCHALRSATGKL
ncbi:fumarate hydratase [Candidatus Omnitrophota bacterium]